MKKTQLSEPTRAFVTANNSISLEYFCRTIRIPVDSLSLSLSLYIILNTMSFSDRRRDGGKVVEGRGVEEKYIPWGIIGAEILRPVALRVTN